MECNTSDETVAARQTFDVLYASSMNNLSHITAFYTFLRLEDERVRDLQTLLQEKGMASHLFGLVLIAREGCNGTVAGTKEAIDSFKSLLQEHFGTILFKDSTSAHQPFKRFKVKIREEIVAIGDTSVYPTSNNNHHLTPSEWQKTIETEDVILLDARNTYETSIGVFEGAVDPKIKTFQEFPQYMKHANLPKDKKILMYCTGGIRCEKALVAMQKEGYENVYQLQGGILQYLAEFPFKNFRGECFVFDHRVAVNQTLAPSERYGLCPHCGDAGDLRSTCLFCKEESVMCEICKEKGKLQVCSKACGDMMKRKRRREAVAQADQTSR